MKHYSNGCITDYPGVGEITDEQVYAYIKKNTHWWQRLDPHFVSDCAIASQLILMGVYKPEDLHQGKKWKIFYR